MTTRLQALSGALVFAAGCSLFSLPVLAQVRESFASVTVVHGGIGIEAREAMQRIQDEYNLRLQFALKGSGEYVSEVKLKISDAKGQSVLETVASGPWLYAKLPNGEYTVTASSGGTTLTQRLAVTSAWRGWVFRF